MRIVISADIEGASGVVSRRELGCAGGEPVGTIIRPPGNGSRRT